MKKVAIFVALAIVFSIPALADGIAMHHEKGEIHHHHHHFRVMGLYKIAKNFKNELKITDTQLNSLKSIAYSNLEKVTKIRNEISQLRIELQKLFDDTTHNYSKISEVMKKISDKRVELFMENLKAKDSALKVLTDEQIEKIKKFKMRFKASKKSFRMKK